MILSCQLTDRSRLTDTVNSDYHNYRIHFLKFIFYRAYAHLISDAFDQQFTAVCRIFDVTFFNFFFQIIQNIIGRCHAKVSHDHDLFQLFIKIIVNGREPAKYAVHSGYDIISGLIKSFYQTSKKTFFF